MSNWDFVHTRICSSCSGILSGTLDGCVFWERSRDNFKPHLLESLSGTRNATTVWLIFATLPHGRILYERFVWASHSTLFGFISPIKEKPGDQAHSKPCPLAGHAPVHCYIIRCVNWRTCHWPNLLAVNRYTSLTAVQSVGIYQGLAFLYSPEQLINFALPIATKQPKK